MSASNSLLERLRQRTLVDCDTLDASVPASLGPFEDCTSNQAIALLELSKPANGSVLHDASEHAKSFSERFTEIPIELLAVEIATVILALRILPHIKGRIHIQTNPFDAYNTQRTIKDAERVIDLAQQLQSNVDTSRLVIKIPSTWEGLQACRQLEIKGIKTLATTLFAFEQAVTAAEAGCHYIAPYLHDLRVVTQAPHFKEERDSSQAIENCVAIQSYFQFHKYSTQVLPAALLDTEECMALAGVQHMTISPALLRELAETGVSVCESRFDLKDGSMFERMVTGYKRNIGLLGRDEQDSTAQEKLSFIDDEVAFRVALSRSDRGFSESKQIYAINEFCESQLKLQDLMSKQLNT